MPAMVRRLVLAAVAVALLLLALAILRSAPPPPPPPPAAPAATSGLRAAAHPAVHFLPQQGAVRLGTSPPQPAAQAEHGAFEGTVVSMLTGRGIPGAQLTFARPEETAAVEAAPDGTFRFEPRVTGRWLLAAATAPGHLAFAPEWGASPVLLEAVPGEVLRGVRISLALAEIYEGLVVDEAGAPVAGAEVQVLGSGPGAATLVPLAGGFASDAAGRFRCTAPDEAVLEARRAGFAAGRARIDYAARISRHVTLRLRRAGDELPAISGWVEDPAGAPAAGAVVTGRPRLDPGQAPATTRADAEGRFALRQLAPGSWLLTASRPGSAPAEGEAPAGAAGVRLRLAGGGRLVGRVRDGRSGAPIAPFTVVVQGSETRTVSVIAPGGGYELDALALGPAVVSVVAPGYAPSPERRVAIPAPPGTASADFELSPGGRLAGMVVERGTRRPLAGATVALEGAPDAEAVPVRNEVATDGEGRFELEGLPDRPGSLMASAPGHHARIAAVPPVGEGERRGPLTVELTPVAAGEEPRVELAGIGAGLQKRGEVLVVTMAVPGGGAAEAGLAPGDEVVAIDGQPVAKLTLGEAIPLLRGPEGTVVTLSVVKGGDPGRATITVPVLRTLMRG